MYLQNEKLQQEERMHNFVTNKVYFFHNGKYGNNICIHCLPGSLLHDGAKHSKC